VLPFYAAQPRNKGNSKDADYMAYLLDTRKRCEDTYLDKTLREFACYFDADNRIQVVVPWLGKDYAFLKKENRDRVRGQDDTLLSDLGQAQMGVDMLLGPFLSSSHSSQAFCGTKLIVRY